MFEDIDKRLQKLRNEEASKNNKASEIPKNVEVTGTTTFEQSLRKKIKECGIVEVFERENGSLKIHPVLVIDKWFFLSLCTNAVLFVLVLTHVVGVW